MKPKSKRGLHRTFDSLYLGLMAISIAWLSSPAALAFSSDSSPEIPLRIAVIVGNNNGNAKDRPLRYAQNDAQKMAHTLQQLGGYSAAHTHLLLGQTALQVQQIFQKVQAQLLHIQQHQPQRGTVVLFYYSGHADPQGLHLGYTQLSFQRIREWLRKIKAQVRLAIVDTCRSGQILRFKGARRVAKDVPLPPIIRNTTAQGMALITSSGTGEDSHELEQLRGSIFTHYMVSGLRGAADTDQDGRVTLREAYSYAYQHTISHTVFLSSGIQHPSFRNELQGHGHIILTRLKRASAQLLFGPQLEGTYYVLNQQRNHLLAELNKERGKPVQLGLDAGRYTIVRRRARSYQVQTVRLKTGHKHSLTHTPMTALSYAWSASKGMSWLTQSLQPPHRIPSPYRTAFYVSLGLAAAGLATTGLFFGLSAKYMNDFQVNLNTKGQNQPELAQTAQTFNATMFVSLGLTGAASVSALVFFLVHRQHVQKQPPDEDKTLPKLSPPPAQTTIRLLGGP